MPISYNNVYITPYNSTKPGLMGNISFHARNRMKYLTMLSNSYGSTGPNKDFRVPKRVKMPIFYNNVYKTPYDGTKPGLMGEYIISDEKQEDISYHFLEQVSIFWSKKVFLCPKRGQNAYFPQ